ncbi:MAG TPA: response regulator transcription factor [Opitutaceae bacterium]|nr:response regulator transcription factor [Opitutaceae bacterium]
MSISPHSLEKDHSSSATPRDSAAPRKYRVLLVDDHPITRQGVRALLEEQPNLAVCGEAGDADAALQCLAAGSPDVVVMDISLRADSGLDLARKFKTSAPHVPILVMSMHDEITYAERALRAGASGYLMKQEAGDKVVAALQQLLRGDVFLTPRVRQRIASRLIPRRRQEAPFPIDTLSDREREVFELIGDGYSTRQIGEKLRLSSKTIDSYREHLKLKLGIESGTELVRHAIDWGRTKGEF